MKIRTGFVSNSSSSSFVLFLKEEVRTVEDVKRIFHKIGSFVTAKINDNNINSELVYERLFEKITGLKSKFLNDIKYRLGDYESRQDSEYRGEWKKEDWEKYENKIYETYIKMFPDRFIYTFDIDDWEYNTDWFINNRLDWDSLEIDFISFNNR